MEITVEVLNRSIQENPVFRFLELQKFLETEAISGLMPSDRRLGYIELCNDAPVFRTNEHGFNGMLSDTSLFRIVEFDVPGAELHGYAAVFREFKNNKETGESIACWVKPEQKAELEARVQEMNLYIARLLKIKK